MEIQHIPVLREEVLEILHPESGGIYVDATVGLGGHTAAILEKSAPNGRLIGIDIDETALAIAEQRLHAFKKRFFLIHGNFAQIPSLLEAHSVSGVDGVLLDLGVSSLQLGTPSRGFSFYDAGPLDMRMNSRQSLSAAQVVNKSRRDELTDIFKCYGEERFAKRIAGGIVEARQKAPITTTRHLAEIIKGSLPPHKRRSGGSRIHPATRVFQALRIYVNSELDNLATGLDAAVQLLKPGARLCVITFHSLEDRIVKHQFQRCARACVCPPKAPICICRHNPSLQILTKRPVRPAEVEIQHNPRARSAKLRAAEKISSATCC